MDGFGIEAAAAFQRFSEQGLTFVLEGNKKGAPLK